NQLPHDPSDLVGAHRLAQFDGKIRLGLFHRDENKPVYNELRYLRPHTAEEKIDLLNAELDRYAV
ncbi:MAG: hypothetical protein JSW71_00690, partial [Gemmatimonadota bacterium]